MPSTEQIRAEVVHEAARLFQRHGYVAASLDLVAREIRLRHASEYFEDGESLAMAAFDYGVECAERVLDASMLDEEGALNRLSGLVDGFREMVESPPYEAGCPVFGVLPHQPGALPFLRSRTQAAVTGWRHRIRRIVRLGVREGEVHPAVNPEEVASIFLNTLEGAAVMYLLYDDASHLNRAQAHLSEYLSGIAA